MSAVLASAVYCQYVCDNLQPAGCSEREVFGRGQALLFHRLVAIDIFIYQIYL